MRKLLLGLSPLSFAPFPITGPVDSVSAVLKETGYSSRLSWQYRDLL